MALTRSMIHQFDVFQNPLIALRGEQPFVVCVQHRDFDHIATRLVAPLATQQLVPRASRLNPMFKLRGRMLYLLPQNLAAFSVRRLRDAVDNLEQERDRIIAAIDLVMTGV